MDYRQVTPPPGIEVDDLDGWQCPGGSASTSSSRFPQDWSPASAMTAGTHLTTPPKSPHKVRELGPTLLPRVRNQDQLVDYVSRPAVSGHARTTSAPVNTGSAQFGSYLPSEPPMDRRSTSPPERSSLLSPASAPSPYDHMMMDAASRRSSVNTSRARSSSNVRSHSRASSSTSIDPLVLGRYGFPTYRQNPAPVPVGANGVAVSRTPSAMSHLAPIAMPQGQMQSYPPRRRTASPPANPSRLSSELDFDSELDVGESSIMVYLTAPNPTPSLTQRTVEVNRAQNSHMWFDIRNLTPWSDFNVKTISSIPGLLDLLRVNISLRNLPTPTRVNSVPETPSQLADMCAQHYAVKVNAALRLAQGQRHMTMRTLKPAAGARQQPEFVSNYESDFEKTIHGDGRGRVVGIVRCYDQWNSGMRNGTPPNKVKYLQSLAHLQRFMREHGCRYGFIITEIELVCVRAGGLPKDTSNVPLFGFIEVAEPIRVSSSGTGPNGNLQMTASLALWYLHMLAKEQPFPGQYYWKMDVGGPAALTRQRHLSRDLWMPKPNVSEVREAKRMRGWVWPDEPLSKRECGRGKRKRT